MSLWRSCLLLIVVLAFVGCKENDNDSDAKAQGRVEKFGLQLGLEGAIAFVPDKKESPSTVWALLVNTSSGKVSTQSVLKHFPALRFKAIHLFPEAQDLKWKDVFVVVPLQGIDINFANCTASGPLEMTNRKQVPKISDFSADYGTACKDCTEAPAKVPKELVVGRLVFKGGRLEFVKPIQNPNIGKNAVWCFGELNGGKCKDQGKIREIAQRAKTSYECTGESMTVELLPFGPNGEAKKETINIFPRSGSVGLEVLNVLPDDITNLDLEHPHEQAPSDELPHFLWFYTLAGKNVDLGKVVMPVMENMESGGKPYCSFVELERLDS